MESAKKTISSIVYGSDETGQSTNSTGPGTHNSDTFSSAGTNHTSSSTAATHNTTSSAATDTKSAPTVHDITTSNGGEGTHSHVGGAHHTAGTHHHQEGSEFRSGTQQYEGTKHHDGSHHHEGPRHSGTPSEPDRADVQTPHQGRDPALVGEPAGTGTGKLTGTAEPGSHSAVFGLTPDGHRETKTSPYSTAPVPASSLGRHSANKAGHNDTSSRAPMGAGVHEQMNRPDNGPKGLERTDPAPAHPGSGSKAGSGTANPLA
ncbi:hypothetical protein A1O1_06625 [Capronia coronata CBS 617.96]|uniref:Uncharacterized protein n=1 Tax=Capronia coronata CBS 617.96 TaxID=1182541 RepID=W9Y9C3_9EURO|nr:uncharacterized protein A1O1_06625 [Capronia coronata CBS 617.96]EXJ86255.1 hypothetical protein A1O1_06625 [Capronia coronata CBS 617.96]